VEGRNPAKAKKKGLNEGEETPKQIEREERWGTTGVTGSVESKRGDCETGARGFT